MVSIHYRLFLGELNGKRITDDDVKQRNQKKAPHRYHHPTTKSTFIFQSSKSSWTMSKSLFLLLLLLPTFLFVFIFPFQRVTKLFFVHQGTSGTVLDESTVTSCAVHLILSFSIFLLGPFFGWNRSNVTFPTRSFSVP